jgi:signal transduction histidine kinase
MHALEDQTTPRKLTLVLAGDADRVRFSVTDNGVGIPPENLRLIFSQGFTTRKEGHGFGLHSGVSAAKELGGSLSVHSEGAGRGSTFTLEIPAVQASPPLPAARASVML